MKTCNQCGFSNSDADNFCKACGHPLEVTAPAAPDAPGGPEAPAPDAPAGYQPPQPDYQQPPTGYQPPSGYQQPPAGYQPPPSGYQQPPAGYPPQQPGYQQPGYPPAPYQTPYAYNNFQMPYGQTQNTTGYMVWSIINLVLCCLLFGILGLVYTNNAKNAMTQPEYEDALKKARIFNLIGTLSPIIIVIVYLILIAVLGLSFGSFMY